MAIELINQSVFLHIPKTGGTWVDRTLYDLGLVKEAFGNRHSNYERTVNHERYRSAGEHLRRAVVRRIKRQFGLHHQTPVMRFCFVRNPLTWYESWWRYMKGKDWKHWGDENNPWNWHPNAVLNGLGSDDFNTFVANVLSKRPGYVTELYFSFANAQIDFVGRMENLATDFRLALSQSGLEIDEQQVAGRSKQNESAGNKEPIVWDPDLRRSTILYELPSLVQFGYLSSELAQELSLDPVRGKHKALSSQPIDAKHLVT
ncbi:MAG: hypothetical protein AAGF31_02245 [Planctomycetota bacterium]